jgi:hypothetical protein
MTDKSLARKSHTICYLFVLDTDIPSDQDAADLISDQQRRALRRCDQGFSTYLSTATVSISEIPFLQDMLRFGLDHQLQKYALSHEKKMSRLTTEGTGPTSPQSDAWPDPQALPARPDIN